MQREAKERKRVLLVAGTGTLGGPTYAELTTLSERPDLVARFDTPFRRELDARMDAYFSQGGSC